MSYVNLSKSFLPREKLMHFGKTTVSNEELVSILLSTGNINKSVQELAKDVLNMANNQVHLLAKLEVNELKQIDGIGSKSMFISLSFRISQ